MTVLKVRGRIQMRARKPELVAAGHIKTRYNRNPVSRRIDVYLHADVLAVLQRMARADGLSMSSLLRGVICDGLANRNSSGGPA